MLTQTKPLNGAYLTIDATSLKAGLYIVHVTTPEAVQMSHLMLQ